MILRYAARRIVLLIPVLIGISLLVFSLIHFAPGDPVFASLGMDYDPEQAQALREELGLDKPVAEQYVWWLGKVLRGDLGRSIVGGETVLNLILSRLPSTVILTLASMAVSLILAIPLGVISAVYRNTIIDNISRILAMIGISMPVFWLGVLLLLYFSLRLRWLPASGAFMEQGWRSLILPAVTLGVSFTALTMRMTRSAMVDVLLEDYIRTAWSKGLSGYLVYVGHALRNALIPIVTIIGMQFGLLLGGAVLTETIFNIPGLGRLLVEAVNRRDYPLIQGVILVTSLIFVAGNLLVDLLYVFLDPRIRYD